MRPFGEIADDYRTALIASTTANTVARKGAPMRFEKFLLFQEHDDRETQAVVRRLFKPVDDVSEADNGDE